MNTLFFENIIFITVPISGRIRIAPYPDCREGRMHIHFTVSLLVLQRFKSSYAVASLLLLLAKIVQNCFPRLLVANSSSFSRLSSDELMP